MENHVTPTRRDVVKAGAAATLGIATVTGLAACGSQSAGGGSQNAAAPAGGNGTAAAADGVLTQVSAVPVGGAIAAKGADGAPIIIAQPTSGTVVAFSAVCTHQGCQVAPAGKSLNCPCHGSRFDALTGAVVKGPANRPLPSVAVKVQGGNVVAG